MRRTGHRRCLKAAVAQGTGSSAVRVYRRYLFTAWTACCALMVAAIGIHPAEASDHPSDSPTDSMQVSVGSEVESLIEQLVSSGDRDAFIRLSDHLSMDQISDRLKAMERPVRDLASGNAEGKGGATVIGPQAGEFRMAFDSRGVLHAVCSVTVRIPEQDYLGNRTRVNTTVYYIVREKGEWGSARELGRFAFSPWGLRLVVGDDDTLHAFFCGRYMHPDVRADGLQPGRGDIVHFIRSPDGAWDDGKGCITENPRLLHLGES